MLVVPGAHTQSMYALRAFHTGPKNPAECLRIAADSKKHLPPFHKKAWNLILYAYATPERPFTFPKELLPQLMPMSYTIKRRAFAIHRCATKALCRKVDYCIPAVTFALRDEFNVRNVIHEHVLYCEKCKHELVTQFLRKYHPNVNTGDTKIDKFKITKKFKRKLDAPILATVKESHPVSTEQLKELFTENQRHADMSGTNEVSTDDSSDSSYELDATESDESDKEYLQQETLDRAYREWDAAKSSTPLAFFGQLHERRWAYKPGTYNSSRGKIRPSVLNWDDEPGEFTDEADDELTDGDHTDGELTDDGAENSKKTPKNEAEDSSDEFKPTK